MKIITPMNNLDTEQTYAETILLVDDETSNLKILTKLLTKEGYKVRASDRPQLAINSALVSPPDLILLDVKMPEIDGYEICRRLKQDDQTQNIPVIFISGLTSLTDKIKGFESGGVDFISKPFQKHEILARVRTHLKLYRMQVNLENMVTQRTSSLHKLNTILKTEIEERKEAEFKLKNYQVRLKALASQLTLVEEKERRRIAVELHDHIGQTLAFSRIQVERAKKYAGEEKQAEILEDLSHNLLGTIQDTKELVFELSSPLLHELGLKAAISYFLKENILKKYGIQTKLIDNTYKILLNDCLGGDLNSILFRNVRELLHNVVKHAKAQKIVITLENTEKEFIIIVQDDGVGFDPETKISMQNISIGFGLFSIKERMADLGGSFDIISKPGKGSRMILTSPI